MARAYVAGFGGVVASEEPLSSYVGVRVLELGGNAVDASVAVSFSLAVLVPHLGGVGGDFFALIVTPNGVVKALNGSGFSPSRFTRGLLESRGLRGVPERGALSIVTPGMVGALYELWRRYGSLEWSRLVRVAASLALGFLAPPSLAKAVNVYSEILVGDEGSRLTYLNPKPTAWEPYRLEGLSRLLGLVAEDPRSFYEGEIAKAIVEYVQSRGGVLDLDDMKSYEPTWLEPLRSSYRNWVLYEIPPNSQGVTTLHILKLLEELEVKVEPLSFERFKLVADIAVPCYKWRDLNVGDPRYMRLSLGELLDRRVLEEIRGLRGTTWRRGSSATSADTTFYAIADREGMVVAGIQSLYYPFGSGVTEPRFQVTLNNRAHDFTWEEGLPNTIGPSKRPLHTLSALIMVNEAQGRIVALGASGGHFRPQLHAIFVTNIVDYGMSLEEAINNPRAAWDWSSGLMVVERSLEGASGGARVVDRLGVANAVEVRGRVRGGATDWRGDGVPIALP